MVILFIVNFLIDIITYPQNEEAALWSLLSLCVFVCVCVYLWTGLQENQSSDSDDQIMHITIYLNVKFEDGPAMSFNCQG